MITPGDILKEWLMLPAFRSAAARLNDPNRTAERHDTVLVKWLQDRLEPLCRDRLDVVTRPSERGRRWTYLHHEGHCCFDTAFACEANGHISWLDDDVGKPCL